jgi:hypothetical protein
VDLTLNTPEALSVPTAQKIRVEKIFVDRDAKVLVCEYKFLASGGVEIPLPSGSASRIFRCGNLSSEQAALCTAPGVPYSSCTGVGTGDCYDRVFNFTLVSHETKRFICGE